MEKPFFDARQDSPTMSETYSDDGVDISLIQWMLELSPLGRLEAAQDMIDSIWLLRGEVVEA